MPAFASPEPVTVQLDLVVGEVRIVASDRTDTTVEVRPTAADHPADTRAAADTRVRFADGRLTVEGPRPGLWRLAWAARTPSVDVIVEVPTGSGVQGRLDYGALDTRGPIGRVEVVANYTAFLQLQRALARHG